MFISVVPIVAYNRKLIGCIWRRRQSIIFLIIDDRFVYCAIFNPFLLMKPIPPISKRADSCELLIRIPRWLSLYAQQWLPMRRCRRRGRYFSIPWRQSSLQGMELLRIQKERHRWVHLERQSNYERCGLPHMP